MIKLMQPLPVAHEQGFRGILALGLGLREPYGGQYPRMHVACDQFRFDRPEHIEVHRTAYFSILDPAMARRHLPEMQIISEMWKSVSEDCLPHHYVTFDIADEASIGKMALECKRVCPEFNLINFQASELGPDLDPPYDRGDRQYFGVIGFKTKESAMLFKLGANIEPWCYVD